MAGYRKVKLKQFPSLGQESVEGSFWKKFKFPVLVQMYAPVTGVDFSPVVPHNFAVTSSTRVQIYSPATHTVTKTLSRFKDIAYSASFRSDGKLIVAGDESAQILLFDLQSRAVLRTFTGHKGPVHVTKFATDNVQVFSASDDKTVRTWDIPSEKEVVVMQGHEDYVRAGSSVAASSSLFITGSYDHKIRMWDTRVGQAVITLDHRHPVEAVLPFPSGSVVVSAGADNELKVWDILGGGKLLHTISNHQKAVTCLAFNGSGNRLLSGSLDQHLKIYNVEDYSVVHSIKYNAPILSVGISPDDSHLVAGLADGILSIRRRVARAEQDAPVQKKRVLHTSNPRYFQRGKSERPQPGDVRVVHFKKPKLQQYDVFLKKFQYKAALDAALSTNNPVIIYSVISELVARRGLEAALSGRDEAALEPLFHYLISNITNPAYSGLLIDCCNTLFDLYGGIVGQSIVIDEMFFKLSSRIKTEIAFQKQIYQLLGSLDLLITSSAQYGS